VLSTQQEMILNGLIQVNDDEERKGRQAGRVYGCQLYVRKDGQAGKVYGCHLYVRKGGQAGESMVASYM